MATLNASHGDRTQGRPRATLVGALLILWLAMMIGGAGAVDHRLLDSLYVGDRPMLRESAQAITLLGDWETVVIVSLLIAALLAWTRGRRDALLLLGITLSGRVLVEIQKILIGRMRPEELDHLVAVRTNSFPSAHAANVMLLSLTVALIAVPPRYRGWALPAALAVAFVVGATRPMLGVHFPSDVLGGWSFGAAWVIAMLMLAERRGLRR